jgi:hypothetical protein
LRRCQAHLDVREGRRELLPVPGLADEIEVKRLGLLTVEERRQRCAPYLANVVRIVSAEWLAWLSKGGGVKKVKPTDSKVFEENRGGFNSLRKTEPAVRFVLEAEEATQSSASVELQTATQRASLQATLWARLRGAFGGAVRGARNPQEA